jgi:protein-tyrosine phosphatase
MCRQASEDGIKTIVATPHTLNGIYENHPQDIEEKVKILNQKLKENNIPLQVLPGSEVHLKYDIIEKLKNQAIMTINKTNYVLLEFPADQIPLIQKGALAQLTAASLCGVFGSKTRKFAQELLANGLIYCIASDAHSDSKSGRNTILSKALTEASKIIGPP